MLELFHVFIILKTIIENGIGITNIDNEAIDPIGDTIGLNINLGKYFSSII